MTPPRLTPWRIALAVCTALTIALIACTALIAAAAIGLLDYGWIITLRRIAEYAAFADGVACFAAAFSLHGWQEWQERKGTLR